jgi:hypothetical protein
MVCALLSALGSWTLDDDYAPGPPQITPRTGGVGVSPGARKTPEIGGLETTRFAEAVA